MSQHQQGKPLVNRPAPVTPEVPAPVQAQQPESTETPESTSEAPALNPELAAQVLALIKSDKSIAQAIGQSLAATAEGRQLLGISGRPAPRRKVNAPVTPQQVKGFVAAYGEITRDDPDFHPVWPDDVQRAGPQAIAAKNLAWEEGRHISAYDQTAVGEAEFLAAHN